MTDPRSVTDALARLADGTAPDSLDYQRVVADAADSLDDVRAAARFVDDGGRTRLRVAVLTARREDDAATVARGRRTLDALAAFRTAARSGVGTTDHSSDRLTASNDDRTVSNDDRTASNDRVIDSPWDGGVRNPRPRDHEAVDSLPPRSRNDFTCRLSITGEDR